MQSIVRYYDETWLDYRILWLNNKNRSVHFGYYEPGVIKHRHALEMLNLVMAKKARITESDHVLDAGCGQGGSALWICENTGATVEGITLVPHQVAVANKEAARRKLQSKAHFTKANYCQTPFPDGSFTVIWACESLCHAEHKADFYREAMRLLKPGGRLVIAEYIRKERPLSSDGEHGLAHWLHKWSIKDIDTWPEHEANLKSIGFTDIVMEDCSSNVMPSLRHLWSMSSKLLPIGEFLLRFGLRNAINHGNHIGSISQYKAFEKGFWFYGIFTATKPTI